MANVTTVQVLQYINSLSIVPGSLEEDVLVRLALIYQPVYVRAMDQLTSGEATLSQFLALPVVDMASVKAVLDSNDLVASGTQAAEETVITYLETVCNLGPTRSAFLDFPHYLHRSILSPMNFCQPVVIDQFGVTPGSFTGMDAVAALHFSTVGFKTGSPAAVAAAGSYGALPVFSLQDAALETLYRTFLQNYFSLPTGLQCELVRSGVDLALTQPIFAYSHYNTNTLPMHPSLIFLLQGIYKQCSPTDFAAIFSNALAQMVTAYLANPSVSSIQPAASAYVQSLAGLVPPVTWQQVAGAWAVTGEDTLREDFFTATAARLFFFRLFSATSFGTVTYSEELAESDQLIGSFDAAAAVLNRIVYLLSAAFPPATMESADVNVN
jgi:hypothetical protein